MQHHERLRVLFREEVLRCQAQNLRKDVIVRHVNRLDAYPDGSDAPGISAWFKVGLLDTYHAGIEVGLGWEGLVASPRGFRKADYTKEERGEVTLMLIGEIPYDFIEDMNPDGDARDHGIDGRVNDHGVDLNRNFPANWAKTWDRDGCWSQGLPRARRAAWRRGGVDADGAVVSLAL